MRVYAFKTIDDIVDIELSSREIDLYNVMESAFYRDGDYQPKKDSEESKYNPRLYTLKNMGRKFNRIASAMIDEGILVRVDPEKPEERYAFKDQDDRYEIPENFVGSIRYYAKIRYSIYNAMKDVINEEENRTFTKHEFVAYFRHVVQKMLDKRVIRLKDNDLYYVAKKMPSCPGAIVFKGPGFYSTDTRTH